MGVVRARWLVGLLATATAAYPQEGEALLLQRIADPDATVRAKAARALARAGGERAVEAARAALDDTDDNVRAAAAVTLVRLGAPDARVVEALAAALSSPDWYTRWDACVALGTLGKGA